MDKAITDNDRRRFLKTVLTSGLALATSCFLSSCGNNINSSTEMPLAFREISDEEAALAENEVEPGLARATTITVKVVIPGISKTISVVSGTTALMTAQKLFTFGASGGITTINGLKGPWKYTVNNILPNVGPANCQLLSACTVTFLKIS